MNVTTHNGIPIRVVTKNDQNNFVLRVSDVKEPAIQTNFMLFSKEQIMLSLNEERRIVTGPVLIPDQLILRNDPETKQPFYLQFSADVVEELMFNFMKENRIHCINLDHNGKDQTPGVFCGEVWMSDKSRGIHPPDAYKELPDRTWYMSQKVYSDIVWQQMKAGEINGYSIEAMLNTMQKMSLVDLLMSDISEVLNS